MSLDGFESESGLSDFVEEARAHVQVFEAQTLMSGDDPATAVCTPLCPSPKFGAPIDALADRLWTATPQEEPAPAPHVATSLPAVSPAVRETQEAETVMNDGERVLFIGDSAHKT